MGNYSEATLLRVGRLLNPSKSGGHLTRLAECMGTTRKNVRNWTAGSEDAQHRTMSGTAKRLVAVLAYYALIGQLSDERMTEIIALESAMEAESRFEALAAHMAKLLKETDDED